MFKFLILSAALAAVTIAAPSGWYNAHHQLPHHEEVVVYHDQQPSYGHHAYPHQYGSDYISPHQVHHVPVATSHQSRTDYHQHSQPIVQYIQPSHVYPQSHQHAALYDYEDSPYASVYEGNHHGHYAHQTPTVVYSGGLPYHHGGGISTSTW